MFCFISHFFIAFPFLDDNKWWTKSSATNKATKASKTIDIEITAYGLLALLENKQYADSLSYFKWLLSQRNDLGGFEGTQDTVVGLKALAKFAERIAIKDSNVRIAVRTEATNETHVTVNAQNALVLQMIEVGSLKFLCIQISLLKNL